MARPDGFKIGRLQTSMRGLDSLNLSPPVGDRITGAPLLSRGCRSEARKLNSKPIL
jgi:hypothetical protein